MKTRPSWPAVLTTVILISKEAANLRPPQLYDYKGQHTKGDLEKLDRFKIPKLACLSIFLFVFEINYDAPLVKITAIALKA
jgi:hypothetical protein